MCSFSAFWYVCYDCLNLSISRRSCTLLKNVHYLGRLFTIVIAPHTSLYATPPLSWPRLFVQQISLYYPSFLPPLPHAFCSLLFMPDRGSLYTSVSHIDHLRSPQSQVSMKGVFPLFHIFFRESSFPLPSSRAISSSRRRHATGFHSVRFCTVGASALFSVLDGAMVIAIPRHNTSHPSPLRGTKVVDIGRFFSLFSPWDRLVCTAGFTALWLAALSAFGSKVTPPSNGTFLLTRLLHPFFPRTVRFRW